MHLTTKSSSLVWLTKVFVTDLQDKVAKPTNWKKNLWELDETDDQNNGLQNEDLIVWMRTAAFPNFRKLYRRIDHDQPEYKDNLPAGNYTLDIVYSMREISPELLLLLIFLSF